MSPYKSVRWFKGKISFLLDKRAAKVFIIMVIATALVFIVSTGIGDMNISPLSVIQVFFGGGTEMEQLVITSFRLPRIIIGLTVGISLAIAGGILQGMIRNPLASPDILGITGGATVAVVGFLAFFSDENNALTVSIKWMPLAAFIGAGVIAILVYFLAWKNGVFTDSSCINRNWYFCSYASSHDFNDDFRSYLSGKSGEYLDYRNCKWIHLG